MVRIERRLIRDPVTKLLLELGEGFTTCGIIVEVAKE